MKGEILNVNADSCIVSGEDGVRYLLQSNLATDGKQLYVGAKIDFIPEEGNMATQAYLVASSSVSMNSLGDGSTRSSAIIAAIGAGLGILSAIPWMGLFFLAGGIITELYAIKKLSANANQPEIFSNMLWGEITQFIGSGIIMLIGVVGFGASLLSGHAGGIGATFVLAVIVAIGVIVFSIMKIYKGLKGLGAAYNVGMLSTSAWLYVAGMILLPFGIGLLLLVAYNITKIIGYLSIK